jgi:multidrug efflux system outer membrane protein
MAPPPTLPAAFEQAQAQGGDRAPAQAADFAAFAAFGSPELAQLIAAANRDSPDLAVAVARVRQADARARQAGAALLPEVDANLDATQFGGGAHGATAHETDWSALLSASYELDFWGRNRAARDAAQALGRANRADLQTARTTLLTSVASLYLQIQSLRERAELARSNLETARSVQGVIDARFAAGLLNPEDVAAQHALVAAAELAIPTLLQQEVAASGALAALVGRPPEAFAVATRPLATLAEPHVTVGVPAQLLQRRPDLRAAEFNLAAAHADVAAARAALFPAISLTASGGIANPAVQAAVITLAGTGYSLTAGANVVQTLFDNGRLRAVTREAAAREEELAAAYRGAILAALVDVENALAGVAHLDAQQAAQSEYLRQSERAFEGARMRYKEGATEFVTVLESQRTLYAARAQYSEYLLARFEARLGLGKALGGGWTGADAQG